MATQDPMDASRGTMVMCGDVCHRTCRTRRAIDAGDPLYTWDAAEVWDAWLGRVRQLLLREAGRASRACKMHVEHDCVVLDSKSTKVFDPGYIVLYNFCVSPFWWFSLPEHLLS